MDNQLLKALSSLFVSDSFPELNSVKKEAMSQSVYSLIGNDADVLKIIGKNIQLNYAQKELESILSPIPYIILKGTVPTGL